LESSLQRLGTDYVDFLFLHEPEIALIGPDEWLDWLLSEQKAGRVRAWGIAGLEKRVSPFVKKCHPLAQVVQTKDSLSERQADFMLKNGRELQFTYGYLAAGGVGDIHSSENRLQRALKRNNTGSVLISTRKIERLQQLGRLGI
jgi:aryl-alcohol dehydrogenase-like predicted oxidoreductase